MVQFETPEDTYRAYKKFLKKGEYKKAYRCLEKMLSEFPDDLDLLQDIINLCLADWEKPDLAKPWLLKLAKLRSLWVDYVLLCRAEAELGNTKQAGSYLTQARKLQKTQSHIHLGAGPGKIFSELKSFIEYKEWQMNTKATIQNSNYEILKSKQIKSHQKPERTKKEDPSRPGMRQDRNKTLKPSDNKEKRIAAISTKEKGPVDQSKTAGEKPHGAGENSPPLPLLHRVPVTIEPFKEEIFSHFLKTSPATLQDLRLFIDYNYLSIQSGFDELLCLSAVHEVDKYWYQIETVKKVLKHFHGRVLLSDEVGLGKTIEAGLLMKEYLLRGLIRNILILTPTPLVSQWREEMLVKFDLEFLTTDDSEFQKDPHSFWQQRFIIASLHTAKSDRHVPSLTGQFYDLVVVDEAHHLKNRNTLAWKLVNQIKKKFIFLLTATPVQNNLIELFNLITLLKPGQFKTEKVFKQEYVKKGNLKATADKERLRELLKDVMIRNTRSAIDLKLPRRFATTMRLEPTETEMDIYRAVSAYLRRNAFKKPLINLLLREAGSSPFALKSSLLRLNGGHDAKEIIEAIGSLQGICKGKALLEILRKKPEEKKVLFTQYINSLDFMADLLGRYDIPYVTFRGDMSNKEKDLAIARFKAETPVLLSTESGGEGRNLQFCRTIINFDLPWNPMRIEQRIGRLHRIGQTRDVFIFNLSIKGTIEDFIIDILDDKINMFEMVIGEIEPILGYIGEERDFEDLILEIWQRSSDMDGLKDGFDRLGQELQEAKSKYLQAKATDTELFGEDYEI